MTVSLIILSTLLLTGVVLYIHHRLSDDGSPAEAPVPEAQSAPEADTEVCCGMHIVCERDSLLAAVSDSVEYYDDEELDAYRGRDAEAYDDAEIEQFRDVLLTLLPGDIAGWARSLQLRGINLPAPVRDELLMVVAEARAGV